MNPSLSQWILAAAFVAVAVLLSYALARLIRQDGYGTLPAPDPRSDWGTPTMPSRPHSTSISSGLRPGP